MPTTLSQRDAPNDTAPILTEVRLREQRRVEWQVAIARTLLWTVLAVVTSISITGGLRNGLFLGAGFAGLSLLAAAYTFLLTRVAFRAWFGFASGIFDTFVLAAVPIGNALAGGRQLELLGVTPGAVGIALAVCLAGLRQSPRLVAAATAIPLVLLGGLLFRELHGQDVIVEGAPLSGLWMVRAVTIAVVGLVVAFAAYNARRLGVATANAVGEYDSLMRLFGRYVAPEIRDEALRLQSAPRTVEVTVLFTDLRSFTALSERISARELLALLNEHFSVVVPVIHAHGGTVNKFIGDAVMATFGAPLPLERHAHRAVQAAVALLHACDELNVRLAAAGRPQLAVGVGIATGEVVVGTLGPKDRVEYAVLGDTVNLAARLEGENKTYGTRILMSGATRKALGGDISVEQLESVTVRGKSEPVEVFTVPAERG